MSNTVAAHYAGQSPVADAIVHGLRRAGVDFDALTTRDLAPVDEFHIRGRKATLELAEKMRLDAASRVLDIGSGLGGPARTLAETYGCVVTGVDLTPEFCDAAEALSSWLELRDRVVFRQGDATALPFGDAEFDAAMTIHVAMNIPAKDLVYAEARRVLKPGGAFAVYDVLQGEGGNVHLPVPWARRPEISHLATPEQMRALLSEAGFVILSETDSTEESQSWFQEMAARIQRDGAPAVSAGAFLGDDYPEMVRNQIRNLAERRIRTMTFICRA